MQQYFKDDVCRNLVSGEKATDETSKHFANDAKTFVEDFGPGNILIFPSTHPMQNVPPRVPNFWHFAPLTLRSTASASDVREKLFQILHELDVHVEATSSFWKYRLQKVCGEAYVDIQCHFFRQDKLNLNWHLQYEQVSEISIDINLLSGDRFVWRDLSQNIRIMFSGGNAKRDRYKPRDYPLKIDQIFHLLEHGTMNDKRKAMRSLALSTSDVDIRKIETWLHRPVGSFLEKEIKRWAEYIKVNRAHL